MSEIEDPVTTVVRLLSRNMRIVKEDGSSASIYVSKEWYDRELFKNHDGQITVGLAESRDMKIEMSGRLRRRLGFLRVNVWATDRPASSDSGRLMRNKMVEEVNRIVRENRTIPNQTRYDFAGLGFQLILAKTDKWLGPVGVKAAKKFYCSESYCYKMNLLYGDWPKWYMMNPNDVFVNYDKLRFELFKLIKD